MVVIVWQLQVRFHQSIELVFPNVSYNFVYSSQNYAADSNMNLKKKHTINYRYKVHWSHNNSLLTIIKLKCLSFYKTLFEISVNSHSLNFYTMYTNCTKTFFCGNSNNSKHKLLETELGHSFCIQFFLNFFIQKASFSRIYGLK